MFGFDGSVPGDLRGFGLGVFFSKEVAIMSIDVENMTQEEYEEMMAECTADAELDGKFGDDA